MKRLMQTVAGLFVAISLAGCCCTQGYVDPNTGIGYGGGWEPCGFIDPFSIIFGCGCIGSCGCGPCDVAPAATCAPGCAPGCSTAPHVSRYGGTVHSTPVIHSPAQNATESVPAGIYEEATPDPQPTPKPAKTGSIIYQTRPVKGHRVQTRDARNTQWVPARL